VSRPIPRLSRRAQWAIAAALGLLLAVVAGAVVVLRSNSAEDLVDQAEPSPRELAVGDYEVRIDTCQRVDADPTAATDRDGDQVKATGTVTAVTAAPKGLDLTVELFDQDGRRVDAMSTLVRPLEPGQTTEWQTKSFRQMLGVESVTCAVGSVSTPHFDSETSPVGT